MSEFASTVLSREEFLGWLGGARVNVIIRPSGLELRNLQDQRVTLLYKKGDESSNAQPIIAITSEQMDEFFAFTATYVASYNPFSAFHHVIPLEMATDVANRRPLDTGEVESFAKVIAGGVLAEHFLRTQSPPAAPGGGGVQFCPHSF